MRPDIAARSPSRNGGGFGHGSGRHLSQGTHLPDGANARPGAAR
jgi:hypothetical protein